MEKEYYDYLIGKKIKEIECTDDEIIFITDNEKIHIERFVPYCANNQRKTGGGYIWHFV